ncbi:MAG: PAS domain-containing protein [Planctomycetota bacterium]
MAGARSEERSERELRLRLLEEVVAGQPGVLFQLALADGVPRLHFVSEQVTALLGYAPAELCDGAADLLALLEPALRDAARRLDGAAEPLADWSGEGSVRRRDGSRCWLRAQARPARTQAGEVVWNGFACAASQPREDAPAPPEAVRGAGDELGGAATDTERVRLEEVLRHREQQLRLFVGHVPAGVVMVDRELRYLSYSRRWLVDYGLGDQDLHGRGHYEIFPEIPERWKEIHRRCLTGVRESCERDRFDRPDGSTTWLRWVIEPWFQADGEVGGLVFFTEVITDRVEAELALEASERRLREAQRIARVGNWELDFTGDRLWWSGTVFELFGLDPARFEPSYEAFLAAIPPEDREAVNAAYQRSLRDRAPYHITHRLLLPSGEVRWVEERCETDFAPGGAPLLSRGTVQDVTDRVLAEAALKASLLALEEVEQRQRLALAAGRMGTWEWVVGSDTLSWDEREAELFGFAPGEFDGRLESFLERLDPEDRALVGRSLEGAPAGASSDDEFRVRLPSGEVRWIRGTGAVRPADGERPARMLGVSYDVTDRVRGEEQLRESLREKEATLREVHHRVKNNLQVISSLLNLQAERIADPAGRSVFLESQSRVRAMALVHETLYGSGSLARIELPQYFDRLCDSLLQSFGGSDRVRIEREIPPVTLDLERAVPAGLIVSELVSNALKYAFPGERAGRIVVALEVAPDGAYTLRVSDDGVGLPPDLDLERPSTLGLYLVSLLARQLRGTLEVGRTASATFTLGFPA